MLRLFKVIPPYPGKDIPVTVSFYFDKFSNSMRAHRIFYYPNRSPIHFNSQIFFSDNNVMIEISEYHLGTTFLWKIVGNQLSFDYQSYVLKVKNGLIKLPMKFIVGRCDAKETALSDNSFSMSVKFTHPWLGTTYEYFGTFEIVEESEKNNGR